MSDQKTGKPKDGITPNSGGFKRRDLLLSGTSLVAASALPGAGVTSSAQAQQPAATPPSGKKPNILIIMTDDVGIWNISAYHRGMMGGRTPNIDRIAREGALFTDYYAQQSCTAGRAAFILGQTPFRTGLLKVGLPAAKQGLQDSDPTIAQLLKPLGYATAQIGKNHLGDRNEYLPTVHGFDEFYGILYHLNAMEEPYEPDYPKSAQFLERFGPRNIVDSKATNVDDPTTDPRWGKVGKQTIVDGGPLPPHPNMDPKAKTNMEDIDAELVRRSVDFMDRSAKANQPFFLWHNTTRMHVWTHLSSKWENKSGYGLYADGMMELDNDVGELLKKLDDLGIADNTIVIFTADNGAETFSWPDGGNSPFRGEKGTTYEGGFRVPLLVKWPGTVKPGTIINDIMANEDWMPTLLAGAGDPNVKDKLLQGMQVGDKTFKQGPPRRLQLCAVFQRRSRPRTTARILLLHGQWRPDGAALRRLETQLQDNQRQSVHRHAGIDQRSARHQPAAGPVGALPGRVDDVRQMVGRQAVDDGARRDHCWPIPCDVQRIPAEPDRRHVEY